MGKKGDIVLVLFPFTDRSGDKLRPALIIGISFDHVIAIFITSNTTKNIWDVSIGATEQTGLHIKSSIRCDKIASFDTKIVQGVIGSVSKSELKQVEIKIKKLLKL